MYAMENYCLKNIANFYSTLNSSLEEIYSKYNFLLSEYFSFILENISFKKPSFLKFITQKGLVTITTVFNLILFYSKNLEMAYYHSQKAYYFYVEYIGQISEEQHTFLQLSSRDATLFVYKKTIFEIPNEVKKVSLFNVAIFDNLTTIQNIHMQFFEIIFEKYTFQSKELQQKIKENIHKLEELFKMIVCLKFSPVDNENILLFFEKVIKNSHLTVEIIYQLCESFLKQYRNFTPKNDNDIKLKILDLTFEDCLSNINKYNKKVFSLFE